MTLELYLPFLLASMAVLMTPGPTVLLVVAFCLAHGRRAVPWTALGVLLGDAVAAGMVILGLTTLMQQLPQLFDGLKWLGVAYLLYLSFGMLRTAWRLHRQQRQQPDLAAMAAAETAPISGWQMLRRCLTVTALNAKGLVFMTAFFPGFINGAAPHLPQFLLLGATFVLLGGVNAALWGLLASLASRLFRRIGFQLALRGLGGLFLALAALLVAATEIGPMAA